MWRRLVIRRKSIVFVQICQIAAAGLLLCAGLAEAQPAAGPVPLILPGHPVQWWAAFKFNARASATPVNDPRRTCPFGGEPLNYKKMKKGDFSQEFVVASSDDPALKEGTSLIGTGNDPIGATFAEVYTGDLSYVVWNDQFYKDPPVPGCDDACDKPWAHSKGFLAWDDSGAGMVVQVSTPSWPGSGSAAHPRTDGNTLGCVHDNDVLVSQHFFALKLSRADTAKLLEALRNEGAVTLPGNLQVVRLRDSSPDELKALVSKLGDSSPEAPKLEKFTLDSGVTLISKPAVLHAPPWQVVSALLDGEPLRVATWVLGDEGLPSTRAKKPQCWSSDLGTPGEIDIAISGKDDMGLLGGNNPNGNHAKIGVSLPSGHHLTIFGDMNQDGRLLTDCDRSQNGRGGLFFVLDNFGLWSSMSALLKGAKAAYDYRTVAEGATPWRPKSRPQTNRHRPSR
jgi:hypothetical protein